jgi:hypothetical protein
MVGEDDNTLFPLPVDAVTPVPPYATANVPLVMFVAFKLVNDAPLPENVAAVIVPVP